MRRRLLAFLVLLVATAMAVGVRPAYAQGAGPSAFEVECGPWKTRQTPVPRDYRSATPSYLEVVEVAHFAYNVEHLIRPMFQYFGSDLSYTLHALPNHPRALVTLMRLGERERSAQPKGLPYTVDCFFRRAVRFAPDDVVAKMLYAQYLGRQSRREDALAQLSAVRELAGDNPLTHYNLGLLYADMREYDAALRQAHLAMALGMPRDDLRLKLQEAGQWREPEMLPPGAGAPSPQAADAAPSSTR